MPPYGIRTETQLEGITVIGEAVQRVKPESAEFLIEVTATAPTAAQAVRENHAKTGQVAQAVAALGVQQGDIHTISLNVQNVYSPVGQPLPAYSLQQAGAGFSPYLAGAGIQADVQYGSYCARNIMRVITREHGRTGEIADAAARAGASILGTFRFRGADEASARRAALEAAGKDARMKAEALAVAAGKQLGEPVAIVEDILASNGMYAALRANIPLAFGPAAPEVAGELEYYARVSANFRLQ